jgi:hypothetical protein
MNLVETILSRRITNLDSLISQITKSNLKDPAINISFDYFDNNELYFLLILDLNRFCSY